MRQSEIGGPWSGGVVEYGNVGVPRLVGIAVRVISLSQSWRCSKEAGAPELAAAKRIEHSITPILQHSSTPRR
jgi:hypothetical protein